MNNLLIPLIIVNISVLFLMGIIIFEKKIPKYIYG
uniref:Uncharacterized protein n=1 Tax=viral metagenome TaxID=1070528 RepID=A0A6C0JST7_9ZZZZ